MSTEPLEIVAAPFELYLAPVGEAMPLIGAEPPGGNWVLVGTSGEDSIGDDGVTATFTETLEHFRSAASTGIRKSFRTEEDLAISLSLIDTTLAAWSHALNFNTVGTSGTDNIIQLYKGAEVACKALLVRGIDQSPYLAGGNIQWELPRVIPTGVPAPVYVKGVPAGIALEFMVLEDLNASSNAQKFGRMLAQTA